MMEGPFLIYLKKNLNILLANDLILADNIYNEVSNKHDKGVYFLYTWKAFLLNFFYLCGSLKRVRLLLICDLEDVMKRVNLFCHHTKIYQ